MKNEPGAQARFIMLVHSVDAEGFGWKILDDADCAELGRSTRVFSTCVEAILDSAHAAAVLNIELS